ncbi:SAV_915 family protein [Kitasatospora sp. NA04385]|uniref:SAV_915 family protein n=1 Tax=Kitasatospora sp. NA04385 TaxID=2742135 RepID=UPI0020CAB728|nr:SAV_915 family protein [Kitasatospora sp. NA04385]
MQQCHDAADPEPADPEPADPEPAEHAPAGLLLIPVRPGPLGRTALVFRTPLGDRTAVAFTSRTLLARVCGPAQPWAELSEPALRALVTPLGITVLTVDPQLVAAAPRNRPRLDAAFTSVLEPPVASRPARGSAPSRTVALRSD